MKCSIIVANFNHADVIGIALSSIENQTYSDWETIIVDDCSTDNSLQVIREIIAVSKHFEKYKLIDLPQNMGVGHAKMTAAAQATGDIISICDPDDALHPDAILKSLQRHIAHPEASLVYSNFFYCDAELTPVSIRQNAGDIIHSDLKEDKVSAFASFKLSAYKRTPGFGPWFRQSEDKDLYYKLEEVGEIIYLDEPLYYYRIWHKGISQGFEAYIRSRDFRLVAIENAVKRREISGIKQLSAKELKKIKTEIHLLQAEGILYSDRPLKLKFIKHLAKALYIQPGQSIKRKLKTLLLLSRFKKIFLNFIK